MICLNIKPLTVNQVLLKAGQRDKFTNGSFKDRTTEIWNVAPKEVKDAIELPQAKKAIRTFVKTLPI